MKDKIEKTVTHTRKKLSIYGSLFFGVGLALVLIMGLVAAFFQLQGIWAKVIVGFLIILGLLVGSVNITSKEEAPYLVGIIALVLLTPMFLQQFVTTFAISNQVFLTFLQTAYSYFLAFSIPGATVVAFKLIFALAKDE